MTTKANHSEESNRLRQTRAAAIYQELESLYPGDAKSLIELDFTTPFELLVMTILAAQSTDVRVCIVAPSLFAKYPDAYALANAPTDDVEELIRSTGFFRNKAKNIIGMSQALVERFDGEVPSEMEDLVTLPGVGRKTANVLRSAALGLPGLAVDTHVKRLSGLLKLTTHKDPEKIETDLCGLFAPEKWGLLSLRLVLHGRRVCIARRPKCETCTLAPLCPSAMTVR